MVFVTRPKKAMLVNTCPCDLSSRLRERGGTELALTHAIRPPAPQLQYSGPYPHMLTVQGCRKLWGSFCSSRVTGPQQPLS